MKLLRIIIALLFLSSIPVTPSEAGEKEEQVWLTLPEIDWVLAIKAPGFALEQKLSGPAGMNAYFMASNKATQVIISGRIEKVERTGSSQDAREHYWEAMKKTNPFALDDIKMGDFGPMATVEYMIRQHQGRYLNQKNLLAYLARDQYWLSLHLSKMNSKEGEEALFHSILRNVVIESKSPGQKMETRYRVSDKDVISFLLPLIWQDEIMRPKAELPPTIVFKSEKKPAAELQVTPIWNPKQEIGFNSPAKIREILEESGNKSLSQAVENTLVLQEIKGVSSSGYYYILTDKTADLKPGEYRYMTQGGIGIENLLLMFTALTNEKNSPFLLAALEMLIHANPNLVSIQK